MRRARPTTALASILLIAVSSLVLVPQAAADDAPSVRLFTTDDELTAAKDRSGYVYFDPGVWVTTVGGALELRASRPDYDTPVSLVQTDAGTGQVLRTLPVELLEGWQGLKDFVHISIRGADGDLVTRGSLPFCPNSFARSRVSDEGPLTPRYPQFCGGNPFTLGTVFGIDHGWAVPVVGGGYSYGNTIGFPADQRRYTVAIWVDGGWAEALGVAPADARVEVALRVVPRRHDHDGEVPDAPMALGGPTAAVPTTTAPPADTLPDLIALPAWNIQTRRERGHDLLAFNATEWNAGPGTLVVEGFRAPNDLRMDAFQYFVSDGEAVGRHPAGSLVYHEEHTHWHFLQFTAYSLINATTGEVQFSGKQSWCLVNTDALDLTVPNANWAAFGGDLFTQCGGRNAIWIREVLDVGWGDTYGQYIPGQAFDITGLPNGRYIVRVEVNPDDLLLESSTANNVTDRIIRLTGSPGNRHVTVRDWHGISDDCVYCA